MVVSICIYRYIDIYCFLSTHLYVYIYIYRYILFAVATVFLSLCIGVCLKIA